MLYNVHCRSALTSMMFKEETRFSNIYFVELLETKVGKILGVG